MIHIFSAQFRTGFDKVKTNWFKSRVGNNVTKFYVLNVRSKFNSFNYKMQLIHFQNKWLTLLENRPFSWNIPFRVYIIKYALYIVIYIEKIQN